MPLSDHEQRVLEQIERHLYAEDRKFAETVGATDLNRFHRRRISRAMLGVVLGVVLLVVGLVQSIVVLTVLGAVAVGTAAAAAVLLWRQFAHAAGHGPSGHVAAPKAGARSHGSIRERLEERWQRRWDERNL